MFYYSIKRLDFASNTKLIDVQYNTSFNNSQCKVFSNKTKLTPSNFLSRNYLTQQTMFKVNFSHFSLNLEILSKLMREC